MKADKDKHRHEAYWQHKLNVIVLAFVCIAVGGLALLRNLDLLSHTFYSFMVSWQMLLIVLGITAILKKKLVPGVILISVGLFFILQYSNWGLPSLWPLWLIIAGVAILLFRRPKRPSVFKQQASGNAGNGMGEGFVFTDVTFGSAKHIVLEPCFRGASLDVTFGGLVLDLRRTCLEEKETYIEIDATFSGVELFIPPYWNVVSELNTTLSGFEDKRLYSHIDIDYGHKLIIRGDIIFGSIYIKS